MGDGDRCLPGFICRCHCWLYFLREPANGRSRLEQGRRQIQEFVSKTKTEKRTAPVPGEWLLKQALSGQIELERRRYCERPTPNVHCWTRCTCDGLARFVFQRCTLA